jgi:alpha-L-rhamnosidase
MRMKRTCLRWLTFLVLLAGCTSQLWAGCTIRPAHLRLESLASPVGVEIAAPRFSWWLAASTSTCRNQIQSAYRIVVMTAPIGSGEQATIWDSGKVIAERHNAVYGGTPLLSATQYIWKLRVWDGHDVVNGWSSTSDWVTGLMHPEDWKASWIAARPDGAITQQARERFQLPLASPEPMPIFRKSFSLAHGERVRSALVFVSGMGQYELRLNDRAVTRDVLTPGWTDYRKHVLYNAYDIISALHANRNTFGILLGNGMYDSPHVAGRYAKFTGSFGQPKMILQLQILYRSGARELIVSDRSWHVTAGPIRFSSPYGGEDADARAEPAGWDTTGFDDRSWSAATEVSGPDGVLEAQMQAPVREQAPLLPVRVTSPEPGTWVYDFGRNHAGWPSLGVRGEPGAIVTLLPGELLDERGLVTQHNVIWDTSTVARFTYTLRGNKRAERWHPRFSYWGYRYLEVKVARPPGSPSTAELPRILSLLSIPVHANAETRGHFSTSNALLARIHRLILGAILSNTMSLLTDCPTREKLGWLEQSYLAGSSILFNFDDDLLYRQVAQDMQDAQLPDGMVPGIAPEYVAFVERNGVSTAFRDSPEWGSAVVLATWEAYRFDGDERILRAHYADMRRYLDYLASREQNGLIRYGLGDWYDLGPGKPGVAQLTSRTVTATGTYLLALDAFVKIAALLGHPEDAIPYAERASRVREAFQQQLAAPSGGSYDYGSQTADAFALDLGVVPSEHRSSVMDALVGDIDAHQDQTTAGDIGFHYVLAALAAGGRSDVVDRMLTQSALPGYAYQLAHGATTLTEAWDAGASSSQDHLMLGHAEEWFYRSLAGLDFDLSRPEEERILIHPTQIASVNAASASFDSVLGPIRAAWHQRRGIFRLDVDIPPGSRATVVLPPGRSEREAAPRRRVVGSGHSVFQERLDPIAAHR